MDGGAWWAAVHGVAQSQAWLSDFTFPFPFHALEKEMATHSSVLAWRIPGTGKPGGLLSMGSHRVRHDWSDLAAAAIFCHVYFLLIFFLNHLRVVADTVILYFEILYLRTSNTLITLGEFEFYTILFIIQFIVKSSNYLTPFIFFCFYPGSTQGLYFVFVLFL